MKMDTSTWKEFRVGDLFELENCKCQNATLLGDGDIPYVGATTVNNGILKYVSDSENKSLLSKGSCLVFICDGQGSNGYQVYIEDDFIGSATCKIGRNKNLNSIRAQFLISVLNGNRDRYGYGYMQKRNMEALSNEVVKLPITFSGDPDWNYMEQYMRSVMENCEKKYQTLVRISQEKHQVDTTAWGEFRVGDVFDIVPCKGVNSTLLEDGDDVPYIAASRVNNGFNRMVSAVNVESWISKGNCLQLIHIGDAAAGWVNYIQNDFIGMSGKSSCAYNERMNEYSGTFIASVLCARNDGQYSFKESWTGEKVVNTVIKLPITSSGEPDWDYMEQYMKRIMQRQSVVVEALRKIA